jgi:probable HAF family extracellular repeat protein
MKPQRRALAALTSFLTLAACAESPVDPGARPTDALAAKGGAHASYVFTRLDVDVPGATQTLASGINAEGTIVGWYTTAVAGVVRGFIYQDGVYTTVVYPGAMATFVRGIGPGGEIVGSYRMPGERPVDIHGFTRTPSGEFAKADYPGHLNTIPQRILPDGTILGCYHDNDTMGSMHGMTINGENFSEIDMRASMHNGATPDGRKIVGLFTDMDMTPNKGRAYLIEDGIFTPFDAPGSRHTEAWDMNPAGTIVGLFQDALAPFGVHGYVLERGDFTTIDYPGAVYTDVFGINPRGDIVGKFREFAGGPFHGYVATRVAGR